ncbi:hypothetical protein LA66_08245 [Aureimonas altamirensis]|uniref:Uncharacterized protein n=1 Tax=Aureimonas altamirensis TaxID=370622 RepID=A0A0B1Q5C8_9HYPH|nr:hypothetical protein [Aureimonas altamirensis]KHJ54581.1 hypothetical protein LA66_08245 [Aureimonas altamirensis]
MERTRPVSAVVFLAEAAAAWPEAGDADPCKAYVMRSIGRLVKNGAAEWSWLPDGTIELRLYAGAVFHLRETDIRRII